MCSRAGRLANDVADSECSNLGHLFSSTQQVVAGMKYACFFDSEIEAGVSFRVEVWQKPGVSALDLTSCTKTNGQTADLSGSAVKVGSALPQSENATKENEHGTEVASSEDDGGWSSSVVPAIILVTSCVALAVVLVVGMVRGRKRHTSNKGNRSSSEPQLDIEEGKMIEMPIR